MRLRVLQAYGLVTIQGLAAGRRRRYGVPPGGAFDRESARLANALLGNDPSAKVVELGMGTLIMDAPDGGVLAVVGAECHVEVDGRERHPQSAIRLRAGANIEVGLRAMGARVYLSGPGGFALQSVESADRVGPRSELRSIESRTPPEARLAEDPVSLQTSRIRVLEGPRRALLPGLSLEESWRVRPQSDRMGVRLEGDAAPHEVELPSEPTCQGAIQATPGGGLLILGPDGPTIGGYPHVATVIEADFDKVAQLRPRDSVRLEIVDRQEAGRAAREARAELERKVGHLALRTEIQ